MPPSCSGRSTSRDVRGTSRCPTSSPVIVTAELPPEVPSEVLDCNDVALENEILELLGADPTIPAAFVVRLHSALASRWSYALAHGMSSSEKTEAREKYPIPVNCPLLKAPQLNAEITPALGESLLKKDKFAQTLQTQLGLGLTPLAVAINHYLSSDETTDAGRTTILPLLFDAGRLLTDLFFPNV